MRKVQCFGLLSGIKSEDQTKSDDAQGSLSLLFKVCYHNIPQNNNSGILISTVTLLNPTGFVLLGSAASTYFHAPRSIREPLNCELLAPPSVEK